MSLPQFYVGQRVAAVADTMAWKKGDIFTILEVQPSPCKCHGCWQVRVTFNYNGNTGCDICGTRTGGPYFNEYCFVPVNDAEAYQAITFTKVMETEKVCVN